MGWKEIEKEIRVVPDNGPVLEELGNLLEAREAIALVGPGASAQLWPLGKEFLRGLIERTQQCGKLNQTEAGFIQKEAVQTPLETAQQLRNKLGDKLYFEYLQEVFSDKTSDQTGEAFTTSQQALLQLPIQNYLTLNYDAGLTNARAYLYPRAVTSYYFWDQEEVRNILRTNGFKRLILHAHGRYDRAGSIILTLDDFRRAYNYAPFVRLLDNLFVLKRLIIVGFELNSPYIKQLLASISGDYKKSPLRHIALVGLDDEQMQAADLLREREEMVYGAQILFYPSRNKHETLSEWLNALADKYALPTRGMRAENTKSVEASPFAYTHVNVAGTINRAKNPQDAGNAKPLPLVDPEQRLLWEQEFHSRLEKLRAAELRKIYRAVSILMHNKYKHLFDTLDAKLKKGEINQANLIFTRFFREYQQVSGLINQSLGASFFSDIDEQARKIATLFQADTPGAEIKNRLIPLKRGLKKTLTRVFNYLEGMQHNLNSLIQAVMESKEDILQNHGIQVKLELESEENMLELFLNKSEISYVLLNLIQNAVESFPSGQKKKLITIRTCRDNDSIGVWVIDNGRGIEKERWESVFDPGNTTKGSDGLGLALCKEAVIKSGGSICIEDSRLDQGTSFKIAFEV